MENFTPVTALIGGGIIGLAALTLLLLTGRVAGISGIVSGLYHKATGERGWRILFIAGLLAGCMIAVTLGAPLPQAPKASSGILIVAGLLVGVGTVLGNGCTSGHGVCGISRLSIRSVVATCTFMASAIITVWLVGVPS